MKYNRNPGEAVLNQAKGKERPCIVVVDQDQSVLDAFVNESDKDLIRFLTANDRPSGQLLISDKENFVAGVIVSANSCDPFGVPLVRFSKQHRPATPVYLLLEEKETEPDKEIVKGLHLAGILRKPLDKQDVVSTVFPYTYFDMERALELAGADPAPVNAEHSAEDKEMHPILAKDMLCGSKSFFDIYVRLGSGRYVKLLKAGDVFDADRVRDYIQKGVRYFYIRKDTQEVYLQYCDSLTGIILHKKETPIDLKVSQVMNYGKETEEFLKSRGFNEATLLTAKQYVTHAHNLIKQLEPERNPDLKRFLGNIALCDHGTGITMMVGLMLGALNFKDEKVINTLALSGFMHDIGLMDMPPKFLDEDESSLSEEEFKVFVNHPIIGYEMARGIRMINPIVPASILEHHERRTGQGFPYGRGPGMIATVSEVVGITDSFVNALKQGSKIPGFNIAEYMERVVYNKFSFHVMEAFDKTFLKVLSSRY
jgi:response regulator RpfG family c-di-GMP phosphodiesterase